MADLYMQMCMKCLVTQDCYAYEDGYICMECFDREQEGSSLRAVGIEVVHPPWMTFDEASDEMTIDLDSFETFLT